MAHKVKIIGGARSSPVDNRKVSSGSATTKLKIADAINAQTSDAVNPEVAPTSVIPNTNISPEDTSPSKIGFSTIASNTDVDNIAAATTQFCCRLKSLES
jgi:hypothetical protein